MYGIQRIKLLNQHKKQTKQTIQQTIKSREVSKYQRQNNFLAHLGFPQKDLEEEREEEV